MKPVVLAKQTCDSGCAAATVACDILEEISASMCFADGYIRLFKERSLVEINF